MPATIAEKQRQRFEYLKAVYEVTDGDSNQPINIVEMGKEQGLSQIESLNVFFYLKGEGLLTDEESGIGTATITHMGIKEVEQALSQPDKPTEHFSVNVINNYGAIGGIQQNVQQSSQLVYFNQQQAQSISDFVDKLRAGMPKLDLTDEATADAQTQIAILDLQERTGKPNRTIVGECLKSVKPILEGAAGNVLASELLVQLHHLLQFLAL